MRDVMVTKKNIASKKDACSDEFSFSGCLVFLEFILEFIHMYARCGHAGTWRARTQRLADTTPWREKNGDATFAGFKFWFVSEKIMSTFAGCFCC